MTGTDYIVQRDKCLDLGHDSDVQRLCGESIALISLSDVVIPVKLPAAFTPTIQFAATPLVEKCLQLMVRGGPLVSGRWFARPPVAHSVTG